MFRYESDRNVFLESQWVCVVNVVCIVNQTNYVSISFFDCVINGQLDFAAKLEIEELRSAKIRTCDMKKIKSFASIAQNIDKTDNALRAHFISELTSSGRIIRERRRRERETEGYSTEEREERATQTSHSG